MNQHLSVNHNQSPIDVLVFFASDIDDTDRKKEREKRTRKNQFQNVYFNVQTQSYNKNSFNCRLSMCHSIKLVFYIHVIVMEVDKVVDEVDLDFVVKFPIVI